jgi:hypothetical protein
MVKALEYKKSFEFRSSNERSSGLPVDPRGSQVSGITKLTHPFPKPKVTTLLKSGVVEMLE